MRALLYFVVVYGLLTLGLNYRDDKALERYAAQLPSACQIAGEHYAS